MSLLRDFAFTVRRIAAALGWRSWNGSSFGGYCCDIPGLSDPMQAGRFDNRQLAEDIERFGFVAMSPQHLRWAAVVELPAPMEGALDWQTRRPRSFLGGDYVFVEHQRVYGITAREFAEGWLIVHGAAALGPRPMVLTGGSEIQGGGSRYVPRCHFSEISKFPLVM